jgi:hypothetical protein
VTRCIDNLLECFMKQLRGSMGLIACAGIIAAASGRHDGAARADWWRYV